MQNKAKESKADKMLVEQHLKPTMPSDSKSHLRIYFLKL